MRGLRCGLLDESFGCGGLTLASELGQSQLSDELQRTRVQWELFDYNNRARTVSNPNPAHVTEMFQFAEGCSLVRGVFQRNLAFDVMDSAILVLVCSRRL
jgi:hypothetical protein